jgi:hypothetical protein
MDADLARQGVSDQDRRRPPFSFWLYAAAIVPLSGVIQGSSGLSIGWGAVILVLLLLFALLNGSNPARLLLIFMAGLSVLGGFIVQWPSPDLMSVCEGVATLLVTGVLLPPAMRAYTGMRNARLDSEPDHA